MLVETLALPQLPPALELRCLLLGRLCSLRQLHLQEPQDLPLGFRRTLQPPLGEMHLPNHLQLRAPHRLQEHHLRHFPHPRALLAGQSRLLLDPLSYSSATLAIAHNKGLLTRFLRCVFFRWRCRCFGLAISIVVLRRLLRNGFFWRRFRRGVRIWWWSKHRWRRRDKHRHARVASSMCFNGVPGPCFGLGVHWHWTSLVIHSLGHVQVTCVVSLQLRFWRKLW